MELIGGDYPNLRLPGGWRSKYTLLLVIYYQLNSEPLASLFDGYYAEAAATWRRWLEIVEFTCWRRWLDSVWRELSA